MATHEYDGIPLSLGAGVNSIALVVLLVGEGWHGPIVMAATGCEWPETDAYVDTFKLWLADRDLAVTMLGPEWRRGKKRMALIDYCEHYRVTPFAGARWCTSMWKIAPIHAWCTANDHDPATLLIGISAEESRRQPDKVRPLVDRGLDRNACARIIQAAGLEVPRKSSCWLCPFQSPRQWRDLLERHPDLFERAARLEEASTERRAAGKGGNSFFDPGGKMSLRQFAQQGTLFSGLDYYVPCMCRL